MSIFNKKQLEILDLIETYCKQSVSIKNTSRYISATEANSTVLYVSRYKNHINNTPMLDVNLWRHGEIVYKRTIIEDMDDLLDLLVEWGYEKASGAKRKFFIDEFIDELC